jgi:uncharacterized protein (DUF362 family)
MFINRRTFFKRIFNGFLSFSFFKSNALASLLSVSFLNKQTGKHPKVYIVKTKKENQADKKTFLRMLNESEINWQKLFNKDDVVGIKVNAIAGSDLSPHPELVYAIVDCLKTVGVSDEKIIIWDRSSGELKSAGFKINESNSGVKCFGTDSRLAGYNDEITVFGKIASCFSRIATDLCTSLINVPVLKDHGMSGVSLSMKNYYGAINNPNKYHDNNCSPYIADLCACDVLRKKTKLVICDGILGQFHGGPGYKPQWTWKYNGIIVSENMVSLDAVGLSIIDEKRKKEKMALIKEEGRFPSYFNVASDKEHNLGTSDLSKIEILEKWV